MLLAPVRPSFAEGLDATLVDIENRWAEAAFEANGRHQVKELRLLLGDVRELHTRFPGKPEAAAWHGIVARSYMDSKGNIGSLRLAKESRDALLAAESMDPLVFGGLIYANLGALYSTAPSGFGGFGNRTRGIGYLWKAIVVDPDGIDANLLYAEVLFDEKNYTAARDALMRANDAPSRNGHQIADQARRSEVAILLAAVERKL